MVACKDAKQSRWLGRGGKPARAEGQPAERALSVVLVSWEADLRLCRYRGAALRGGAPAGQRPIWRTKDTYGAPRSARLHGFPKPAVFRFRIGIVVRHEVEHGLLGIELVRTLVALVAPHA
jgi:hypothetical protein